MELSYSTRRNLRKEANQLSYLTRIIIRNDDELSSSDRTVDTVPPTTPIVATRPVAIDENEYLYPGRKVSILSPPPTHPFYTSTNTHHLDHLSSNFTKMNSSKNDNVAVKSDQYTSFEQDFKICSPASSAAGKTSTTPKSKMHSTNEINASVKTSQIKSNSLVRRPLLEGEVYNPVSTYYANGIKFTIKRESGSDYKLPDNFTSKKGHYDTSKKYIHVNDSRSAGNTRRVWTNRSTKKKSVALNSQGKLQGDFVKHQPRKLPPATFNIQVAKKEETYYAQHPSYQLAQRIKLVSDEKAIRRMVYEFVHESLFTEDENNQLVEKYLANLDMIIEGSVVWQGYDLVAVPKIVELDNDEPENPFDYQEPTEEEEIDRLIDSLDSTPKPVPKERMSNPVTKKPTHQKKKRVVQEEPVGEPTQLPSNFYSELPMVPVTTRIAHQSKKTVLSRYGKSLPEEATISADFKTIALNGTAAPLFNCASHADSSDTCPLCRPMFDFRPCSYLIDYNRLAMYTGSKKWHIVPITKIQTQSKEVKKGILGSIGSIAAGGIDVMGRIATAVIDFIGDYAADFFLAVLSLCTAEDMQDYYAAHELMFGKAVGKITAELTPDSFLVATIASIIYDFITDLRPWSIGLVASYLVRLVSFVTQFTDSVSVRVSTIYKRVTSFISPKLWEYASYDENETDRIIYNSERQEAVRFSKSSKTITPPQDDSTTDDDSTIVDAEEIPASDCVKTESFAHNASHVTNFWTKFGNALRIFNGFSTAVKTMNNFAHYIISLLPTFVTDWFNQTTPERKWFDFTQVKDGPWQDYVQLSLALDRLLDDGIDAELLAAWHDARRKVESFIAGNSNKSGRDELRFMTENNKKFYNVEPRPMSKRMEPMTMYISGSSRIGKSACVSQMISNLLGVDNPHDHYYTRNTLNENWDGYNPKQHQVVVYDDFGAIDNSQFGYQEVKELIHIVSTGVYITPMASLDSAAIGKKGTHFKSDFIIMLSNAHPPTSEEVKHTEAYHNRIHFQVRAVRKSRATGYPDVPTDYVNFSHLTFELNKTPRGFCMCGDSVALICEKCFRIRARRVEFHELCALYDYEYQIRKQAYRETDECRSVSNLYKKRDFSRLLRLIKEDPKAMTNNQVEAMMSGGNNTLSTHFKKQGMTTKVALNGVATLLATYGLTKSALRIPAFCSDFKRTRNMWFAVGGLLEVIQLAASATIAISSMSAVVSAIKERFCQPTFATESFETITKARRPQHRNVMTTEASCLKAGNLTRVTVMWKDEDGAPTTVVQNCIVSGKTVLTTAHAYRNIRYPATIHLRGGLDSVDYNLDSKMVYFFPRRDLMRIDLIATNLPSVKTMKHVMYDKTINDKNKFFGVMVALRADPSNDLCMVAECTYQTRNLYDEKRNEPFLGKATDLISGHFITQEGDCGAPVINTTGKVVGLHFGASDYETFAVPITFDDFLVDTKESLVKLESQTHKWYINEPAIKSLGTPIRDQVHFLPVKSNIVKSPIFGRITETKVGPSVLSPHDKRNKSGHSPLVLAISKYNVKPYTLFEKDLCEAREFLRSKWNLSNEVEYRVLSIDEVLNGSSQTYCNGMNMSTSAGFGYPNTPNGKRALFKFSDRYSIDSALLQANLDDLHQTFKNGDIQTQVVVDCLKDETRSLEKIAKGKTRLFNIYPVHYNILVNMYFGAAVEHMISLHNVKDTIFTIGMNPYSTQWDRFVRKHMAMNDNCFDGDGASFDAQFNTRQVMQSSLRMITEWATSNMSGKQKADHIRTMEAVFWSGVEVDHIAGNFAYKTQQGVQSGWPLTTLINSCTISQLLYLAYAASVPHELANPIDFCDNVALSVFGDDHVVSPSPLVEEYYNFGSTQRFMEALGLGYTSGLKQEETRELWPIGSTTFLKNTIGKSGPFYVAQLAHDSIYEMLNWITKNGDPWELLGDNIRTAQRFLYFYGKAKFQEFADTIKVVVPNVPLLSYEYLQNQFMSNGAWKGFNPFLFSRKHALLDRENVAKLLNPIGRDNNFITMQSNKESNVAVESNQTSIITQAEILTGLASKALPHILETAGDIFGLSLDLPTDPTERSRKTKAGQLNLIKGVFPGTILRNDTSAMTRTDDQHFKEDSMTSVADIASIPTNIIQQVNLYGWTDFPKWSNTDPAGKALFYTKVGPLAEVADNSATYIGGAGGPTALSYASIPFSDWNGSIDYTIKVYASSAFHKGALRVAFHPGVFDPSNLNSVAENTSQYFADMNISAGTTSIIVSCPFIAPYSTLKVCNSNDVQNFDVMKHFFTGILLVTVAKKLVVSGNAAPSISFDVRVSAGKDYKVYNTTNHNQSIILSTEQNLGIETTPFKTQSKSTQSSPVASATAATMETEQKSVSVGGTTVSQGVNMSSTSTRKHVPKRKSVRTARTMPEEPWTMKDTRSKLLQFDNFVWTSTPAAGTIIKTWAIPGDIQSCSISKIGKERFTLQSYDNIRIEAHISGSAFESGALQLVFVPLVEKANFPTNAISPLLDSATQVDVMQSVILEPHSDKAHDLLIPFRHPQEMLKEQLGDSLGVLVAMVRTPLTAAATFAYDVDVSLFATFENAEIYAPQPCNIAPTQNMVVHPSMTRFNTQSDVVKTLNATQKTESDQGQVLEELIQTPFETKETVPDTPFQPSRPETKPIKLAKKPNNNIAIKNYTKRDVAHFEDTTQNVMELCKKFYPVYVLNFESSANPDVITLNVADLVFLSLLNRGGIFAYYAAFFRAFRGDIRFKIVVQAKEVKNGEVMDLHMVTSFDNERRYVSTDLSSILFNAGLSPAAGNGGRNSNVVRTIVSNANQEVINVEIPYTNTGNFAIPRTYIDSADEPFSLGYINIVHASDYDLVSYTMTVYMAVGDSAALGVPFRIPRLVINPNQRPDDWSSDRAVQLYRDRPTYTPNEPNHNSNNSESEYAVIIVPDRRESTQNPQFRKAVKKSVFL